MATQAQILANQANSARSTGPRTEAGKAASARNATTHGFSTGLFQVDAEDQPYWDSLTSQLEHEVRPHGALERDAVCELRDAYFRLRQIRKILAGLAAEHAADPLVHPATAAAVRQLTRYRAAAEMQLYRALEALMDLQLLRAGRMAHMTPAEESYIGPLVDPDVYAVQEFGIHRLDRRGRERFEHNVAFVPDIEAAHLAAIGLKCDTPEIPWVPGT
jgi:hypothetical protein